MKDNDPKPIAHCRKACAYVRVSTDEQAKHQTSIDSQIAAIERWCAANDVDLAKSFVEPGISDTDENRPQFVAMMNKATGDGRPFDLVIVYSLSRFARDLAVQLVKYRQLDQAAVELISISEQFAKGSAGNLMRAVVGAFNQHYSDETSRHTIRTMRANAAEGFFNGGQIPFGYHSVVVERRGNKEKKKLAIRGSEAAIVRLIFQLASVGSGSGPMGVRAIAAFLNKRGDDLRGGKFHNSNVADILARRHYVGFYLDGKRGDDGELLPEEQWIRVPCPPIIDPEMFAAVAARRAERRPRSTPPRVTNGVTMLPAKLARCGEPGCNGGLTVRSGKGGRYHYYTCEHRVNRSRDACTLPPMPRKMLDDIVLDAIEQRVLAPDHLTALLAGLLEKSDEAEQRRRRALADARAARTEACKAISNLIKLVEQGALGPDDPLIVSRISQQRARERTLATEIVSIERQLSIAKKKITPEIIRRFGLALSARRRDGDPNFRRAYAGLLVDKVELSSTTVRISGSRAALEHALIKDEDTPPGAVPIFDREWCPWPDSNQHALRHSILSRARLPISPQGQRGLARRTRRAPQAPHNS
jgi:site-specific DNA recombinase